MITIIYTYRNRDLRRIENSFNSLKDQTSANFEVEFVDYGSAFEAAEKARALCEKFSFINYTYHYTEHQPWNKSRALNSIIKNLENDFCFVADVDLIFHPEFIEKVTQLQKPIKSFYFQVGFLTSGVEGTPKNFDIGNYRKSTWEATGLSMFPVNVLKGLRGFDEFYHFWGAEDTDMHVRLRNAGYEVDFYDKEILLLHQWHPSYRSKERKTLTNDLQIGGVVQLNQQYLSNVKAQKKTQANLKVWGEPMSVSQNKVLEELPVTFCMDNDRKKIDEFLYGQLPQFLIGNIKIQVKEISSYEAAKFRLKRVARRKVPEFYTLKEVNDLILLHLISFYRDYPYIFQVNKEEGIITFGIIKQ